MSELVLERNNIPTGWINVKLNDVCLKIIDGVHKTPKYTKDGIRFISIANIRPFKFISENYVRYISKTEHNEISKRVDPKKDDVLLTKIGTLGYAKIVDWDWDFNIFVGLALIRPNKRLLIPKFLEILMNCPQIISETNDGANGSGRKTLPLMNLKPIMVHLPPLNEQKRIVEKTEELFSLITQIEEILKNSIHQIANLSQKIIDDYTLIIDSKRGSEYQLGNIAEIKGGVTLGRKIKGKTTTLPYLRVANVQDGYLDLEQIKEISVLEQEKDKWLLQYGDILLTEGGDRDKLGRGTIWQEQIPNCIHQNHIFRVRLDSTKFIPEYISMILRSSSSKQFFQSKGKQSVNLASINKTQLSSFSFFCPDINIQKQRLETIQQSLEKLQFFSKTTYYLLKITYELKKSILKKAFEGKLVPQDPNEESAEILFQKIKQEKEKYEVKVKQEKEQLIQKQKTSRSRKNVQ